jgi:hypothetical protein
VGEVVNIMEERIFSWGKYGFQYFVFREDRKSVSLRVTPRLKIILKCPKEMSDKALNEFLQRKYNWVAKQLDFFKKFQKKSEKEYISGEAILYLGRQYKLVIKKAKDDRVVLKGGDLVVLSTDAANGRHNKALLDDWYRQRAKEIFAFRLKEMMKKFNYEVEPILLVRKLAKKWGSFTGKKRIYLNTKLIQASRECIDYVIVHELCHFKYCDHGNKFYGLLSSKIANWEKIKDKLEMRFL